MSNEKLKETLDEAEWEWLKSHAQRDGIILVAPGVDLLEAGDAIASDSSRRVEKWIKEGLLGKPTGEQLKAWDASPKKRFLSLVVQPYVLIQELFFH